MIERVRRVFVPALLAAVAWLSVAESAWAVGAVRKAPAPTWVAGAALPQPNPARSRQVHDGLYFLLLDVQLRPGAPATSYRRTAYKVTDRSGLEGGGSIDLEFNPATQELNLNHVRVIRGGVARDRLPAIRPRVLDREDEASNGVFVGWKTAHIELDDIRVGDVVDYAYTIETRDPQFGGHMSATQDLTWGVPIGLMRLRVVWPQGRPLTLKQYGGAPQPRLTRAGGYDIREWTVVDQEPVLEDERAPGWAEQWARVRISSMTSWAEVAAAMLPLYAQPDRLPPSWAAAVDKIARASNDPEARITQALRLVQDEVRYVSLSLGSGAYQPRSPETVIRSGYGDCKDKALLLSVILRRLGIDATPALVDVDMGQALPQEAPSPNAFDHVVVRIGLNGAVHWVDPTRSHQGGRFPNLSPVRYGWALPIVPGQAKLESIVPRPFDETTMSVVERYEAPRTAERPLRLTVVTTYRDGDADWLRSTVANGSAAALEQQYLKFYTGMYPGIRNTRSLEIADDRDLNVVTLREAYELPVDSEDKTPLWRSFPIRASSMDDYRAPPNGRRTFPLQLPRLVNKQHRIEIVTPGAKPPAPGDEKFEGAAFSFALDVERKGETLTLDYRLKGLKELLPPEEVEAYRAEVTRLENAAYWNLDLKSQAGGTIGEEYLWAGYLFVGVVGILGLAALVLGLRWGVRSDDAYAAEGRFYPVSLSKFLFMNVATAGLYDIYWAWKCWRWVRRQEGRPIAPFWRAFFNVIWLYGLFDEVNRRLAMRAWPVWVGVVSAVAYLVFAVASSAINRIPDAPPGLFLVTLPSFVCLLPTVIGVLRLNAEAPQVTANNSRFTRYSAVAVLGGLIWWALILFGAFASD